MKLNYTLTQEEFLEAMKIHHDSKKVLLWVVLGTVLAIYFALTTDFSSVQSILTQLAIVIVAAAFYVFVRRIIHNYVHKKFYNSTSFSSEISLSTDEESLKIVKQDAEIVVPWDDISKWGYDDDFYLIYTSISAFHIIPTRVMSKEDIEELEGHLEGKFKMLQGD